MLDTESLYSMESHKRILDTGTSHLIDTEYRILDTGYWILDTGYWMLDTESLYSIVPH